MGLFDGTMIDIYLSDWWDGVKDRTKLLFTDVEVEGKKRGYEKAAKEYEPVLSELQKERKIIEEIIKDQKRIYTTKANALVMRLEHLEKKKDQLESKLINKTEDFSRKYNVPASTVTGMGMLYFDIFGYKEKKLKAAEMRGYTEAKEVFEQKVANLRQEIRQLKEKGSQEIQQLVNLISSIFDDIAKMQTEIVKLEILLQ